MNILHLYISPGHNYFGHHGRDPAAHPVCEVSRLHCLAGRGIEGDRFLDYKANYKGQITFFAHDVYESLCRSLGVLDQSPGVLRRNVVTTGVDLNTLVGRSFELQDVQFEGIEECRPCSWMDRAFYPGAEEWLKWRGGLRARILTDGWLRAPNA
jgi:MOSC domain-containing protein YiiM